MKKVFALVTVLAAAPFAQVQAETLLERGTYLMKGIVACGNCHTAKGGPMAQHELAGGFQMKEGPIDAVTPNLTPDKETGIGNWTDAQLMVAIRDGKRPDGSLIGPPMPYDMYRGLSDRDTKAIIAYLRNLKPVKNATRKSVYKMPLPPRLRAACRLYRGCAAHRQGRLWRLPRRATRPLHGMPHADDQATVSGLQNQDGRWRIQVRGPLG